MTAGIARPSIEALAAELALHRLVADYCLELDTTAGLRATLLMTDDCRMDLGAMQLNGHAEIQRFYEGFATRVQAAGGGGRATRHVATNLRVTFDGTDRAAIAFIVLNFSALGSAPLSGGTVPTIVSDVRLDCRRGPDGGWRIASLGGGPVFIGDDPLQNDALIGQDADDGDRPA